MTTTKKTAISTSKHESRLLLSSREPDVAGADAFSSKRSIVEALSTP
jgi:hypothetical protein